MDPDKIASDYDDSDYVNKDFGPLVLLAEETERIQWTPRGKAFLTPKPLAPINNLEKFNRDKGVTEKKQNEKDDKK